MTKVAGVKGRSYMPSDLEMIMDHQVNFEPGAGLLVRNGLLLPYIDDGHEWFPGGCHFSVNNY